MDKEMVDIKNLAELVKVSVDSRKIKEDYPDFLKYCKDMGVSSYILNLLIRKYGEAQKERVNELFDLSFFALLEPYQTFKQEIPAGERTIVKVVKKNSRVLWGVTFFLFVGCIVELVFLFSFYIKKKDLDKEVETKIEQNLYINEKIREISSLTTNLSNDISFRNWTSDNHKHNSESHISYKFNACAGDKLSFNYFSSSERGYDYLSVRLIGDKISPMELARASGECRSSKTYVFKNNGSYMLSVNYQKDENVHALNDNAGVSDIRLYRNYLSLLDSIHKISTSLLKQK